MEEIKVCYICLIGSVKMYDLQSYPLYTYFQSFSGFNLLSIVNMRPYVCYECGVLVKKFYLFKQKCHRSHAILKGLLDHTGKVKSSELNKIDRDYLSLSSNLTRLSLQPITISHIKEEIEDDNTYDRTSFHSGECQIKEEHDILSLKGVESSDDEEPLSSHKEKKSAESPEIQGDIKNEESKLDNTYVIETSVPITNDRVSALLGNRKQGQPKKPMKKATSKKVKITDFKNQFTIINLSIEEQIEEINKRKESSKYLNSPYQCNVCYIGCTDTDAWKYHVWKHSQSAGDIVCPICKFRFRTKRIMQKHYSHHKKKYICKTCSHVSTHLIQAKHHEERHGGVTYKCKFCDDVFTQWSTYIKHVRKHPSDFICDTCGSSCVSKMGLALHKSRMHQEFTVKGVQMIGDGPYCEECDVKFVSTEAYNRHVIMSSKHTGSSNTINGCRKCGKTFDNAEELRSHRRKEHRRIEHRIDKPAGPAAGITFPAKCQHCSEVIPNGIGFWWHYRRMHPNESYPEFTQKDYMCDICGKSFRCNALLIGHKRTHAEERSYKCSQCDKAFFNRFNLNTHEKIHTDSRPYACSECPKAFRFKGALDRHLRCHTGKKPYKCEVCGKAFTQSNSVKLHVTTVHLKQPTPYISRGRKKNIDKDT